MQQALLTFASLLLIGIASPIHTQETAPLSGSGSVQTESGRSLTEVLASIHSTVTMKKDVLPVSMAVAAKDRQEWQTESARIRQRLWQNRQDCSEAIRRANRDTLMEVATRCVRNDLLQEMALLRSQQTYSAALPLANASMHTTVQSTTAAFMDASIAIIDAIDAGLFQSMDTLKQTARNLHAQYRLALRQSLAFLRLERERTWILSITQQMEAVQENDVTAARILLPGALCLEEIALLVREESTNNDSAKTAARLLAVRTHAEKCRILLQEGISAMQESEEPQE